jgi:hypothetical protein
VNINATEQHSATLLAACRAQQALPPSLIAEWPHVADQLYHRVPGIAYHFIQAHQARLQRQQPGRTLKPAMAASTSAALKDKIRADYATLLDNFNNLLRCARLPDESAEARPQVRAGLMAVVRP